MEFHDRSPSAWIGAGVLGTVLVMLVGTIGLVYAGAFNVAATETHLAFSRWAFQTMFERSVARRSATVALPDAITPSAVDAGARSYKAMCQHCHSGPGVRREEWASGMRPRPPFLAEAAAQWTLEETYWIAKHGIKMTGMPAFGATHDDQRLWGGRHS